MLASEGPVVVEQTYPVSADRVWNAITVLDEMRRWYFEAIPAFEPVVGFETTFNVHHEGRDFPHRWKISKVEPGKLIEYNWKCDGYEGDSFVSFELFREGTGTRLRLTQRVIEDFSEDIEAFSRESCTAGWSYFIQNALKAYLE